jgi:hypothetical protein
VFVGPSRPGCPTGSQQNTRQQTTVETEEPSRCWQPVDGGHLQRRSSSASMWSTAQGRGSSFSRVAWKDTPPCGQAAEEDGRQQAVRQQVSGSVVCAAKYTAAVHCGCACQEQAGGVPRGTSRWWLRSPGQKCSLKKRRAARRPSGRAAGGNVRSGGSEGQGRVRMGAIRHNSPTASCCN